MPGNKYKYSNAEVASSHSRRSLKSRSTTTPPAHVEGNAYLIPTGATTPWDTHIGELAGSDGAAWIYQDSPPDGFRVWIEDESLGLVCAGGAFVVYEAKNNFEASVDPVVGDDTGDGYSKGSIWINAGKVFVCTDPAVGAAVWKDVSASGPTYVYTPYDFEWTDNADWAINGFGALTSSPSNAGVPILRLDDTTEEGPGFRIKVPAGVTNMIIKPDWMAITGATSKKVGLKFYNRDIGDNTAIGSWSSGHKMTNVISANNTNFQYDSETIALSTLGITAGRLTQCQITRDDVDSPSLSGDIGLGLLTVSFS